MRRASPLQSAMWIRWVGPRHLFQILSAREKQNLGEMWELEYVFFNLSSAFSRAGSEDEAENELFDQMERLAEKVRTCCHEW